MIILFDCSQTPKSPDSGLVVLMARINQSFLKLFESNTYTIYDNSDRESSLSLLTGYVFAGFYLFPWETILTTVKKNSKNRLPLNLLIIV